MDILIVNLGYRDVDVKEIRELVRHTRIAHYYFNLLTIQQLDRVLG